MPVPDGGQPQDPAGLVDRRVRGGIGQLITPSRPSRASFPARLRAGQQLVVGGHRRGGPPVRRQRRLAARQCDHRRPPRPAGAGAAGISAALARAAPACLRASTATTSGEQVPALQRRGDPGPHRRGRQPPVQQQHLDQRPGPGPSPSRARATSHSCWYAAVNVPAARACASGTDPGSAPGLRTRISR